jgi:CheY-like chemotaxis protein
MAATPPIEVLLVEDNAGDIRLTLEAFKDAELPIRLSVARDGEEALAFLRQEGQYARAPRPNLVLLDLNMPKKDGREVLRDVKTDPEFKMIPVIVLTTSAAETDIAKSYDLHANCYIQKPAAYDEFLELIRRLETIWFGVVQLPSTTKEATP